MKETKRTSAAIAIAVERLATVQYFPAKDEVVKRDEIAALLKRMVRDEQALERLVMAMIDVGRWYGPGELRGVLCCLDEPADGKQAICLETPGYRAQDLEAQHAARELERSERKLLAAVPEPPLDDEERAFIETMNTRVKQLAADQRGAFRGR